MRSSFSSLHAPLEKVPPEFVVYPQAGYGINLPNSSFVYRADDTEDAWAKTVAHPFTRRC